MKKDEVIISTDKEQLRGVLLAWVKDSGSNPLDYLTKEGVSYLDGYLQGNDLTELIKKERYDKLVEDYEELIGKYEQLKNSYVAVKQDLTELREKNKRRWF
jgi:hypothetical protein